ncbi:MAG: hypothetical protein EPN97_14795 [Alphaproteobacteria bacterium]|nr:MAG: hypothetical protein EPN97_14795 [Alphaproteobacteria bacterium]
MFHKRYIVVGSDGVLHERNHKPSAHFHRALTTSTDGTDIQEIWINPARAPKALPYMWADDANVASLGPEKSAHLLTHEHAAQQFVVNIATTDKRARQYGWADADAMKDGVETTLKSLPPEILSHVTIAYVR